jgi:hypothetical protein
VGGWLLLVPVLVAEGWTLWELVMGARPYSELRWARLVHAGSCQTNNADFRGSDENPHSLPAPGWAPSRPAAQW